MEKNLVLHTLHEDVQKMLAIGIEMLLNNSTWYVTWGNYNVREAYAMLLLPLFLGYVMEHCCQLPSVDTAQRYFETHNEKWTASSGP